MDTVAATVLIIGFSMLGYLGGYKHGKKSKAEHVGQLSFLVDKYISWMGNNAVFMDEMGKSESGNYNPAQVQKKWDLNDKFIIAINKSMKTLKTGLD